MNPIAVGPLAVLACLGLAGCNGAGPAPPPAPPPAPADVKAPNSRTPAPASAPAPAPLRSLAADLGRASDDVDQTCADYKTAPTRWGVLILGAEKDLAAAERKALEISARTGVPFSRAGYSLDPRTKKPVYERSHEGEYFARTEQCADGAACITIERSSAYTRFTPDLYIIVGAVLDEQAPDSLAAFRAAVPDAYVKFSPLAGDDGGYGGTSQCMDWDVIVLARTRSFAEAEAIAREVSAQTAVPYAARTPPPSTQDYYSGRNRPYPRISIESDNAYGEREESPYFLVVGGEHGEEAPPDLFERYRKVVPNAYRMKRARHVCGQ